MLSSLETSVIFPVITVFYLLIFFAYYRKISRPLPDSTEWVNMAVCKPSLTFMMARHPMERKDIAPLLIILAVFSFLAFFQLGAREAPESFFQFTREQRAIIIELDEPEEIGSLMFYTGLWTGHYTLEFSPDGIQWLRQMSPDDRAVAEGGMRQPGHVYAMDQPFAHVFKWRHAYLNWDNPPVKFIRITSSTVPMELGEIALFSADGALIPASRISSPDAPELFDEQRLIPERPTYMNSMYFDEIYHGRAGYEYLRGVPPFETTHPPLGKVFIALSIHVFGMNPFGWRFIGALFGVLMLLILYVFIKNMFGKTMVATCGTLLFGFDFMRFVQTRIATIDTYAVLFCIINNALCKGDVFLKWKA